MYVICYNNMIPFDLVVKGKTFNTIAEYVKISTNCDVNLLLRKPPQVCAHIKAFNERFSGAGDRQRDLYNILKCSTPRSCSSSSPSSIGSNV